jgi:hypothetical protein
MQGVRLMDISRMEAAGEEPTAGIAVYRYVPRSGVSSLGIVANELESQDDTTSISTATGSASTAIEVDEIAMNINVGGGQARNQVVVSVWLEWRITFRHKRAASVCARCLLICSCSPASLMLNERVNEGTCMRSIDRSFLVLTLFLLPSLSVTLSCCGCCAD